ncbi:MAG: SRPBCC domain-containing protein [Actinomycetota bacterium]|nr:SRPBCC domain-containing protein [Actinomycetota bacterium]
MRIEGERRFDAPPEAVYRALTDPDEMAEAFSAIERIDAEAGEWTVTARPPFPGGFRLRFSVRLDELRQDEHARLLAWGKSLGGRISIDSSFDLEPDGKGTLMRWAAEVDAAGIFTGLGSQSLGPVATHQAERALDNLAESLLPRVR